jgi:ABC-type glycerol-3-phosphate transport system substrate-binding protein
MRKSRILEALLIAVLVLGTVPMLAAAPVKIDIWMTPVAPEETLKGLVAEYNKSQDKIAVNLSMLDWASGREQIRQSIASKVAPDLFYMGVGLTKDYIDSGVLLPLSEAGFSKQDLDMFNPLIGMNMADGKVLAAPLYYDSYLLYYRSDILAKYGFKQPPKTWDELKTIAKAISTGSKGEVIGFQIKGADDHLNAINLAWQTFLEQAGGNFFDAKANKSTLNTPEGKRALEYMKSFYSEGISTLGTSAINGFREGKVAMFEFAQNQIKFEKLDENPALAGKWAVAPVPAGPASKGAYAGGQAVSISASSKNKAAAGEFLKWLVRPANMVVWMQNGHGIPVYDLTKVDAASRKAVEAVMAKDANWGPIMTQIKLNGPTMMVQQRFGYGSRWDAQKRIIPAALSGKMSVDQALSSLDAEINQAVQ